MKMLFEKHLCPREFGSAVFNVSALLKWANEKGYHLLTVPPLDDYDFAQVENVLSLIALRPHRTSTTDEAAAHIATKPELAQHPTAESAPAFLVGADAEKSWREIFRNAISGGELVLLDRYSLLPVESADAPAPKVKAVPVATISNDDWKVQARAIADECFDHDTNAIPTVRDSLATKNTVGHITGGYCFRVMVLMQERGIKGARGFITNPATIMRDALQGDLWWANKQK